MCCFLRIHFSIPFSNRRFLTSDRLSHNPPEPPRSQFSNFNHSHGQHSCRQRERDYYPSNSTVHCSQPTNAYRHPKTTIQHSEFMTHEQSYIHPSTEQWFSILEETKSPLFSRIHCFPVHPRLTVPGQLRNARKAYGPGMVHAISTAAVTSCSPRSSLFTSSALSLVTPMTDRSAILQPGKKTHAVFEKLRATRRAACVHLFPSLPPVT